MAKKELVPKGKLLRRVKQHEDHWRIEEMEVGDYIDEKSIEFMMNRDIGRDIPNIEDGMTPVERRMLYTMFHEGLGPNSKREKVATIVGATIELVYPHGDMPLNQTNARIGRHWNMMIPYIDGEGNFGNIYTKKEASMRYRKARLSHYSWDCFFSETEKNNPNFDVKPNYNYSDFEPIWLPTKYPNILLQWNTGIGIGVSSTIAAFNSKELLEATIKLMHDPEAKIDIYPDTPMPLYIINKKELKNCFDKNSFTIETVAPYTIEYEKFRGEEMCYIVFKSVSITANLKSIEDTIKKIKKDDENSAVKKLKEVKDIKVNVAAKASDDRKAMSPDDTKKLDFKIEIEKGYDPHTVAAKIITMTHFGTSIGASYNVVKDGMVLRSTPRMILLEWINSRMSQKYRTVQQELATLFYDILVAEGMLKIHSQKDGVDKLVKIVRFHKNPSGGKANKQEIIMELVRVLALNPKQAEYIYNSNIGTLSSLSVEELEKKHKKLKSRYDELRDLCNDDDMKKLIISELEEGIKKYGVPRNATFKNMDEVQQRDLYLVYNDKGYYCVDNLNYKMDVDKSFKVLKFNTLDELVVLYSNGTVANLVGTMFKEAMLNAKTAMFITDGNSFKVNDIVSILIHDKKNNFIVLATEKGYMKALDYKEVTKKSSVSIIKLEDDDRVVSVNIAKSLENNIITMNCEDRMYYVDGKSVPLQKKGSSGNKLFKKNNLPVSSVSIIGKDDELVMLYGDSGYVKIIPAQYVNPTKDAYISMMGKNIKGVVGLKNKKKIALYELSGETEIRLQYDEKTKLITMTTENGEVKFKASSTVGTPHKLFKKSKNELYEIYNK